MKLGVVRVLKWRMTWTEHVALNPSDRRDRFEYLDVHWEDTARHL
jgi:hypothetical protein